MGPTGGALECFHRGRAALWPESPPERPRPLLVEWNILMLDVSLTSGRGALRGRVSEDLLHPGCADPAFVQVTQELGGLCRTLNSRGPKGSGLGPGWCRGTCTPGLGGSPLALASVPENSRASTQNLGSGWLSWKSLMGSHRPTVVRPAPGVAAWPPPSLPMTLYAFALMSPRSVSGAPAAYQALF